MNDRSYRFIFASVAAILLQSPVLAQEWKRTTREIQLSLSDKGLDAGSADGIWGKKSAAALKLFQRSQNLPETGVLDETTAERLFGSRDAAPGELSRSIEQEEKPAVAQDENESTKITGHLEGQISKNTVPISGEKAFPFLLTEQQVAEPKVTVPPVENTAEQASESVTLEPNGTSPPAKISIWTYLILGWALFSLRIWYRRRKSRKIVASASETPSAHNYPSSSSFIPHTVGDNLLSEITAGAIEHRDDIKSGISMLPTTLDGRKAISEQKEKPADRSDVRQLPVKEEIKQALPSGWIPAGTEVSIGSHVIKGGMIYVGESLPKQGSYDENENCLINPKLPVGRSGDPTGESMWYWPSYAQISKEARKSFLDWLASSRSNPADAISFVFLYFYGLERRLMLEVNAPDAADILCEVRRLKDVYGGNGSFRRYASALIEAYEVKSAIYPGQLSIDLEERSYEIPMALKIALGLQVGAQEPIPPDMLLIYVLAHPETRIRTPAKRIGEILLKQIFSDELHSHFPKGLKISRKSGRKLKLNYRACSRSFEVEIQPLGLDLVDVTQRNEPINSGRKIFEACMDQLDDYSRALGRSEGLRPTLPAIAKLPVRYRKQEADFLPDKPLLRLEEMCSDGADTSLAELASLVGLDPEKISGRAKLVELSRTLAAFGYGCTADPAFSLKAPKNEDRVAVFALGSQVDTAVEPSGEYKTAQLSLMLGLIIAFADGKIHDLELARLYESIEIFDGISSDERSRLKAELKINAADPAKITDLTRRLRDVPPETREAIANAIVAVAAADGSLQPEEVSQLEKLFRQMSLDPQSLYSRLHGQISLSTPKALAKDDDLPLVIPPTLGAGGASIPPPFTPKSRVSHVNTSRLEAIREETRVASNVLADIFADEIESEALASPPAHIMSSSEEESLFEGLEHRYGLLLKELISRQEWPGSEFDRLSREAGLMPAAATEVLNNWSLERWDELLLEGDGPVVVNLHLLPQSNDSVTLC